MGGTVTTVTHWTELDAALHGQPTARGSLDSLRVARIARYICIALLILAGVSLLLVKIGSGAKPSITPPAFLFRAGLCLMHLYYLQLVLNLLVFHVPAQSFRIQTLIIPFLLVIAYSTGIYEIISRFPDTFPDWLVEARDRVKFVSIMAFIAVYYYWCIRDYCESFHTQGGTRRVRQIWAFLDFLVLVALVGFALTTGDISKEYSWGFGIKDACIAFCIGAYELFARFSWWIEKGFYSDKYRGYLQEQSTPVVKAGPRQSPMDAASQWLTTHSDAMLVDFGCADSRRFLWFLKELKCTPGTKFDVIRYDTNADWCDKDSDDGKELFNEPAPFICDLPALQQETKTRPCLVHASHVLYDRQAVTDLCSFLKSHQQPYCLIVRGYGESIFRQVSVFQSLTGSRSKNVSHFWDTIYLRHLIETCGLIPADREAWIGADLQQEMPKGKRSFVVLEEFFRVLYGISWTEMSSVFVRETFSNLRGTTIPNPDVIYFFSHG